VKEVTLLAPQRAQNIMIALRRQPLTEQIVEALRSLDMDSEALSPEACEVLMGAMPTSEEAKQLINFRGSVKALREVERQLLPLAQIERPAPGPRLRLVLFARTMSDLAVDVRSGLVTVREAFDGARQSPAFRIVLHHTVRLGNVINHGATRAEEDVVSGFGLDALPRLALFKAAKNQRVTLLHVLVAQVAAVEPDLPHALLNELGGARQAYLRPLAPLVEDVTAFRSEASHVAACVAASGPLAQLNERATSEANALEAELAAAREAANAALSFFAMAAQPHELDAKAMELLGLLAEFLDTFKRCLQEIEANPEMAALCHSGAADRPCTTVGRGAEAAKAGDAARMKAAAPVVTSKIGSSTAQ